MQKATFCIMNYVLLCVKRWPFKHKSAAFWLSNLHIQPLFLSFYMLSDAILMLSGCCFISTKVYFRYLRFERLYGAYAYILHIRACMVQFTLSVNFKGVT